MFVRKLLIGIGVLLMVVNAPLYAKGGALSEPEVADLLFMREEEKLARDVYEELYEYYKQSGIELTVLAFIADSEQQHMDAMLRLLTKYKLEDPANGAERGEFENTALTALYQNLVSDSDTNETVLNEPASGGKVSPTAALYVGAWIEERDMLDIMHAIANTTHTDIAGVYTNLLCGSRSHLRAFVKNIGEDQYEPQILYSVDDAGTEAPPEQTLEFWLSDESDTICP